MERSQATKISKRAAQRSTVAADITCQKYCSSGEIREFEGVLYNFSRKGIYIESQVQYPSGSVLIVRIRHYPSTISPTASEQPPRSIGLAQVKWCRELKDENTVRYGMGLQYLQ